METYIQPINVSVPQVKLSGTANKTDSAETFSNIMWNALQEVNRLQLKADQSTEKMVLGEVNDIHQVMLDTEQAKLALQLTVQIRNKLVEAYQEISRMQF